MEKSSENLNHELKIINDRCTDLENRLYCERNLRKRVEKDLHELQKNMQDGSNKNSHKGKPCYERQHSSKNSSDKPTEKAAMMIRNIWNSMATEMKKKTCCVI